MRVANSVGEGAFVRKPRTIVTWSAEFPRTALGRRHPRLARRIEIDRQLLDSLAPSGKRGSLETKPSHKALVQYNRVAARDLLIEGGVDPQVASYLTCFLPHKPPRIAAWLRHRWAHTPPVFLTRERQQIMKSSIGSALKSATIADLERAIGPVPSMSALGRRYFEFPR